MNLMDGKERWPAVIQTNKARPKSLDRILLQGGRFKKHLFYQFIFTFATHVASNRIHLMNV